MFVSMQSKNLQQNLTSSKLKDPNNVKRKDIAEDAGCFKCGRCRVVCPKMREEKWFKSTVTGRTYKIRKHLDCNSMWVVYLVTCVKCHKNYVGKSETTFKIRHSNHKREIKLKSDGVGEHFNECGYENFSVILIDQIEISDKVTNKKALKTTELYWQHQLRTYVENGGINKGREY